MPDRVDDDGDSQMQSSPEAEDSMLPEETADAGGINLAASQSTRPTTRSSQNLAPAAPQSQTATQNGAVYEKQSHPSGYTWDRAERAPGYTWMNRKAQDDYFRAMEFIVDQKRMIKDKYGDPLA